MITTESDGTSVAQKGRFEDSLAVDVGLGLGVAGCDGDHAGLGVGHHAVTWMDEWGRR